MNDVGGRTSDELGRLMDRWASALESLVGIGNAVGESNRLGPIEGSPFDHAVRTSLGVPSMPLGGIELVTRDSFAYLSGGGRHCLAIAHLLRAREAFLSLMPLLRAQVEIYGRIAWFLEPVDEEGQAISPDQRLARHHMDVLASLCRRRYSASRRGDGRAKVRAIKSDRDATRLKVLEAFPDAYLAWSGPSDESKWICGGENFVGLGRGAELFDRVAVSGARGTYDSISDFAHPSTVAIRQLMRHRALDDRVEFDWHVGVDDLALQAWNSGAMHSQAIRLLGEWTGIDLNDEVDEALNVLRASAKEWS